jgi:hypothetical protein
MKTDMRNFNIRSRSIKGGGMKFEMVCEIDSESFYHMSNMDLTGSYAEQVELNIETVEPEPEKPKGGPLSISAAGLCMTPKFFEFAWKAEGTNESIDLGPTAEDDMAEYCREFILRRCAITSRAELDHNQEAASKFKTLMADYRAWLETNP